MSVTDKHELKAKTELVDLRRRLQAQIDRLSDELAHALAGINVEADTEDVLGRLERGATALEQDADRLGRELRLLNQHLARVDAEVQTYTLRDLHASAPALCRQLEASISRLAASLHALNLDARGLRPAVAKAAEIRSDYETRATNVRAALGDVPEDLRAYPVPAHLTGLPNGLLALFGTPDNPGPLGLWLNDVREAGLLR